MNKRFLAVLLAGLVSANAWSANAWPADAGARAPSSEAGEETRRAPVADRPYSATHTLTVRRQQPEGGEFFKETVTKLYRDSEGRTRRDMLDSDGYPSQSIIVNTDGAVLILDHRNKTMSPGAPRRHAPVRRGPNPDVPQMTMAREAAAKPVVRQLGVREMAGVTATGQLSTYRIGKGADAQGIKTESWTSKELGITLYVKNVDAKGESIIAIGDLDRGEPDPALFAAPDDYRLKP